MSKRAEELAVEYQIKTHGPNVMGGASMLSEEEYMRFNMNLDFKNGYERAEKDLGWHPSTEHPSVDETVIVLIEDFDFKHPRALKMAFAHIPNPNGWDERSTLTGKMMHYTPEMYDGWSVPGVKWWMPCPKLPKEDENESE